MEREPNDRSQRSWLAAVVVLSLGWLLIYAARTALSSALKDIGDYWGLSAAYLGFLSSAFFVSYTILQIPTGILADKFGSRKVLLLGFAVQAVGLFLGTLSRNPVQFLASRVLTGAGQATYFACQQAIISFTLPPERRSVGTAATVAGAGLGSAVGFLLGKLISLGSLGWRMPFAVLGALCVIYILIVLAVVPEPRGRTGGGRKAALTAGAACVAAVSARTAGSAAPGAHAAGSAQAAAPGAHTAGSAQAAAPAVQASPVQAAPPQVGLGWGFLACLTVGHFLSMYGFTLMLSWLPYYLETVRDLKGGLSAVVPVVMPLIMAPATIIWGMAADKHGRRDFVLWVAMPIGSLAMAAIPLMRTPALLALALGLYGATGKLVIDPALIATVAENSPPEKRNSALAVFNLAAAFAMMIAPAMTGFIAQVTGSFDISLYAAGLFNLIALGAFFQGMRILERAKRQAAVMPGEAVARG